MGASGLNLGQTHDRSTTRLHRERASGDDVTLDFNAHIRGQKGQALGRSRGGFSTKIHLKCDFDGLPLAFHLTGGEASDSRNFETLLDIGPDITPRAVIGDKGYDSKANRKAARRRGICPVIPYRSNATAKPKFFPSTLCSFWTLFGVDRLSNLPVPRHVLRLP